MLGSILVVDDEEQLSGTVRDFFTEQGYRVDTAMNAGDALMLLTLHRPDAVILDIRLPDRSGAELLPDLLAVDDTLPVVMLSGSDDEALARSTLKGGAFDYVRKPFDLQALDRAVTLAVMVGRQKPRRGVVVPFHPERRRTDHSRNGSTERVPCPRCLEPVLDKSAVVEKGILFHATCWLRLQRPTHA